MTAPLISPGLIKKMRTIANRGLQTNVVVMRRMAVEEGLYGDDVEQWVTLNEYKGWMKMTNIPRLDNVGGVIGAIGVYRLHLEASVEVRAADLVIMDGDEFVVQDDNHEDTYRVFTTATLRRRQ
jgi:hypothetical protein